VPSGRPYWTRTNQQWHCGWCGWGHDSKTAAYNCTHPAGRYVRERAAESSSSAGARNNAGLGRQRPADVRELVPA